MSPRTVTTTIAVIRVGLGAALFAAPQATGATWLGAAADDERTQSVLRGLGARDVAIGLGALAALARGRSADRWVEAAIVADGADAAAAVLARRTLAPTSFIATVLIAGGAALAGIWARFAADPEA